MRKLVTFFCVIFAAFLISCAAESAKVEITPPAEGKDTLEQSTNTPIPPTVAPVPASHTPLPPTDMPMPPTLNALEIAITQQALTPETASAEAPATEEVVITSDILYVEAIDSEAQDQYLDIYAPASPGAYPVVLWAHGLRGDKSDGRSLGRILAKEGIVTVAVSFRSYDLLNQYEDTDQEIAILREVLEEAQCALQLIGGQIEDFGGDPDRVIWAGYSYGAWLGSLVTFGQGDLQSLWDEYAAADNGPPQQVVCAEQVEPAEVQAFLGSGTLIFSDFWFGTELNDDPTAEVSELQEFAAIGHHPEMKVRLIYGEHDNYVDTVVVGSEHFAAALEESGYDVAIYRQDGPHEPFWDKVIEQILTLVQE